MTSKKAVGMLSQKAEEVAKEILKEIEANNSMKLYPHFDAHPDPKTVIAQSLLAFAEQASRQAAESMKEMCAVMALATYKYDEDPKGSRRELDCSQRIADKIRSLPIPEDGGR